MDLSKRHFLQLLGAGAALAIAGAGSALTGASDAVAEMVHRTVDTDQRFTEIVAAEAPDAVGALDPAAYVGHAGDQVDAVLGDAVRLLARLDAQRDAAQR